jgi:hypothetical protein
MDAVFLLSKFMRTNQNRFAYAGTKDTRGVTSQLVTVKHITANQLAGTVLFPLSSSQHPKATNSIGTASWCGALLSLTATTP